MSDQQLVIGDPESPEESYYLGRTAHVLDFGRWTQGLPEEGFAELKALARDGATTLGTPVAVQIGLALRDHPPEVEGVEATATEIADSLFGLSDGTRASLTS